VDISSFIIFCTFENPENKSKFLTQAAIP